MVVSVGIVVVGAKGKVVELVDDEAVATSVNIADTVLWAGGDNFTVEGKKAIVMRMSGVNLIVDGSVVIFGVTCAKEFQ